MENSNAITKYDGLNMPYSPEAEQAVLGAIILDSSALCKVISILDNPDYFYIENHQTIYDAMLEMYHNKIAIDFVTLFESLLKKGFDNQDCKTYLMDLVNNCPSISNAREYAKIVRQKHELRSLIKTSWEIIEKCTLGQVDTENILLTAKKKLISINPFIETEEIKENYTIQIGFDEIDSITGGLHNGDLIYIGSQPGMGKTSFALNITQNVLLNNKSIAFFSLDKSEKQIRQQLIETEALINLNKIRNNNLCDEEKERIKTANDIISKYKLFIDDTPLINIDEIDKKLTQAGKIDLVIIDYFQLITSDGRTGNSVEEISLTSYKLKCLTKKYNIPIICLTQIPRYCEYRENTRPILRDIDKTSIGQDADIVLFLYQENYYNKNANKTAAECIIAKNRHGVKDITVHLNWYDEYMLFTSKDSDPLDELVVNIIPTLFEDSNKNEKEH